MTNPHNFLNGMGSVGYPFNLMPLSIHQNALFNPMNSFQFSPFSNQIGFTYMIPQQRILNQFPLYKLAPMMSSFPVENIQNNMLSRLQEKFENTE